MGIIFARKPVPTTSVEEVTRQTLDKLVGQISSWGIPDGMTIDELYVYVNKTTGWLEEAIVPDESMGRRPLRWALRFKLKRENIYAVSVMTSCLNDIWLNSQIFNAADRAEIFAALDWLEFQLRFSDDPEVVAALGSH